MGKHYTSEEKGRALLLVREEVQEHGSGTKACSAASSPLGISKDTLRGWYRRDEVDWGPYVALTLGTASGGAPRSTQPPGRLPPLTH